MDLGTQPIDELCLSNGARCGLTGFVAGLSRKTVKFDVPIVARSNLRSAAAGVVLALGAGPAVAADVLGTWATAEDKSHVEVVPCAEAAEQLCGSIVWLKEPNDDTGQPKLDKNNPDPALQSRPIVGLPLLAGFVKAAEPDVWEDGEIYNPEDGDTYSCTMTLLEDGRLEVRGYVGLPLFGKSQTWTRVTAN